MSNRVIGSIVWELCYWLEHLLYFLPLWLVSGFNDVVSKIGLKLSFVSRHRQITVVWRLFSSSPLLTLLSLIHLCLMSCIVLPRRGWEKWLSHFTLLIMVVSRRVLLVILVWMLLDGCQVIIGIVSGKDFFDCILLLLRLLSRLSLVNVFLTALLWFAN